MRRSTEHPWARSDGELGRFVTREAEKTLSSYREQPNHVHAHANQEQDTARGGYANRQVFEWRRCAGAADGPAAAGLEREQGVIHVIADNIDSLNDWLDGTDRKAGSDYTGCIRGRGAVLPLTTRR